MSQSFVDLLKFIDTRKAQLDALRPLPPATVASLHDKQALEWTYNSNAIEGNTLSVTMLLRRERRSALCPGAERPRDSR